MTEKRPWFTEFLIESDGRPDSQVVWVDEGIRQAVVRKPTRAEKLPILLAGAFVIGSIVVMAIILIVAVYISRH